MIVRRVLFLTCLSILLVYAIMVILRRRETRYLGIQNAISGSILPETRISGPTSNNSNGQQPRPNPPIIFVVTPTHARLEQKANLISMSHTLRLVKGVHWILVEDSPAKTPLVAKLLNQSCLQYTHLNAWTEENSIKSKSGQLVQRGLLQRNTGLEWLRTHPYPRSHRGVVYFADDDNTYSLELFDEMRQTEKVSVWPVGLLGNLRYETPIVQDKKVVGWFAWNAKRKFAIDMCGFAVNLKVVQDHPNAVFYRSRHDGRLETDFLTGLGIAKDDLEPRAKLCTQILVWHTRTEKTVVQRTNIETQVFIKDGTKDKEKLTEWFTSDSNFEV